MRTTNKQHKRSNEASDDAMRSSLLGLLADIARVFAEIYVYSLSDDEADCLEQFFDEEAAQTPAKKAARRKSKRKVATHD